VRKIMLGEVLGPGGGATGGTHHCISTAPIRWTRTRPAQSSVGNYRHGHKAAGVHLLKLPPAKHTHPQQVAKHDPCRLSNGVRQAFRPEDPDNSGDRDVSFQNHRRPYHAETQLTTVGPAETARVANDTP